MLYYSVLCCTYCAVCFAVLRCIVLFFVVLCYVVLHCAVSVVPRRVVLYVLCTNCVLVFKSLQSTGCEFFPTDVPFNCALIFMSLQGTGWEHVPTDIPFKSISMGCKHRVWSVAKNGTAYFRAGFSGNKKTGNTTKPCSRCW